MIELRPYQLHGANWLTSRRRAYLADEPRVGKTPQALLAASNLGARRIMVYGPASARPVWPKMLERMQAYFPLEVPELRFLSYSEVVCRGTTGLEGWHPDVVIFDEAHRLKNTEAKVTQILLGTKHGHRGVVRDVGTIWALSGTPMPNHPGELFTIFARFWPEAAVTRGATTKERWDALFCEYADVPGRRFGHNPFRIYSGVRNAEVLKRMMYEEAGGRFLRRTFSEVTGQLEPIEWLEEWIEAEPTELKRLLADEDVQAAQQLLAGMTEELPAEGMHVMRARHLVGLLKARHAFRLIEERRERGEKVVVIAWHTAVLDILEGYYPGCVRVDGSTPPAERERRRLKFQEGDAQIFLGQLQAVKEGIDLSAADHMLLLEPGWTPGDNTQVSRRLLNIGKSRPCTVTVVGLADTFDEQLAALLVRKQRGQEELDLG